METETNPQTDTSALPGRGGGRSFEHAVAEYEAPLLRYATGFVMDASAAQDVVQEVLIKLARSWDSHPLPYGEIRFWLFRLTHNAAIDYLRQEKRRRRLHEENRVFVPATTEAVTGEQLTGEQKQEILLEHVSALDDAERQVLLLRLQQGLSYRDISRVTGRTEGNVGCILHNAVKNLARELKKKGVI